MTPEERMVGAAVKVRHRPSYTVLVPRTVEQAIARSERSGAAKSGQEPGRVITVPHQLPEIPARSITHESVAVEETTSVLLEGQVRSAARRVSGAPLNGLTRTRCRSRRASCSG